METETKSDFDRLKELICHQTFALQCAAQANYWVHFATSKTNALRNVLKGGSQGEPMTRQELEEYAFGIAQNHLHNLDETRNKMFQI